MKVKSISYGRIHYIAGCTQCDFSSAIDISHGKDHAGIRADVRKHVLKTGHECWIESGTHTKYMRVDEKVGEK